MKVNPIIRFAVERRVTMAMAVLGVLVLGWLSLTRLPLEFLPTFSSSYISVNAPYPSSSPAETERLIVRPLEDSLGTINGIETLTANATSSSGSVSLRFVDGTDMDLAAVDVRDRVDRVRHRLPADLERVDIRRFQSSDRPVMRFQVSADWPRERLYRFTEDVIVRRLQRLEGVADVEVRGVEIREVQINLIPDRLAALGIDVREVAAVIRSNHETASVGTVRDGSRVWFVRVDGKLKNLDEIRALPLGGGLRLGDVAEVDMAYPEQEEWDFLNGQEALSVRLYKASTANLLAMIDGAKAEIEAILELPDAAGLHVNIYRDDSADVRNGLGELRNTGLLGGALAVLFMYLFLRRVRTTLLVAIAIPVSVVVTFVFMYLSRQAGWTDLTLNIMSLMGLMLSIGMLVDNSIVVIESIFRHHEELGEDARTATLHGASEVALPIAASTLTTMCVFLPMIFLPSGGRFAIFMTNIGLTVVVVMAASLVVAVTVVPMVAARMLGGERAPRGRSVGPLLSRVRALPRLHAATPARLRDRGRAGAGRLVVPLPADRAELFGPVLRTPDQHRGRHPEELLGRAEAGPLRRGLRAPRRAPRRARDRQHHPHLPSQLGPLARLVARQPFRHLPRRRGAGAARHLRHPRPDRGPAAHPCRRDLHAVTVDARPLGVGIEHRAAAPRRPLRDPRDPRRPGAWRRCGPCPASATPTRRSRAATWRSWCAPTANAPWQPGCRRRRWPRACRRPCRHER